jgi:hypothetical protein
MNAVMAVSQVDRVGGFVLAVIGGGWLLVDGLRDLRRTRRGGGRSSSSGVRS